MSATTDLEDRLAARTLELVDIASESRAEASIAGHICELMRSAGVPVTDTQDACVLAGVPCRSGRPLVLLAGHLDTVPAQGNWPGRRGGGCIEGLGASDMKGGVAVMLELALAAPRCDLDVGYVLFGREELPSTYSALAPLLVREPGLRGADLAIMLEPTSNALQAGCLGNLDARWSFRGRAGHSARPWQADNAIERAAEGVLALKTIAPRRSTIAGLDFTSVASVTALHGGIAANVIPGEAKAGVNFRYAPDLTAAQAEATLRGWCEPHGELDILNNAAGAPPPKNNALLERLLAASEVTLEPKQAWTPVAEFAAAGIEAVNFGPGDPSLAHRRDERIETSALARCYNVLEAFLCG